MQMTANDQNIMTLKSAMIKVQSRLVSNGIGGRGRSDAEKNRCEGTRGFFGNSEIIRSFNPCDLATAS